MKLTRKPVKEESEILEDNSLDEDTDITDDNMTDDYLGGDGLLNDFYGEGQATPMDKHKDLLKNMTNFNPFLKDAINSWLGLIWNEEKREYEKNPAVTPIMNIKGAAWCCGFLKTYTRQNNIITDISEEDYKNIMLDVVEAVWLNLGTRQDLGINNDGDLLRVANEMEHAVALVLMGAGNGKYNKFLGTTYSHHSTETGGVPMQQNRYVMPRKKGLVGKIRTLLVGE